MLIKKKRFGFFITIPVLLLVLSVAMQSTNFTDSVPLPEVLSVTHQPLAVTYQTNLTITITFDYAINVTGVQIQYCQIEPAFTCHFPKIDMIFLTSWVWAGSFIVLEESGVIGYKLYITHQTTNFVSPNETDYLGYDNIVEPATGQFYFSIDLSSTTDTAPVNFGLPCISLTFGAMVLIRRKMRSMAKSIKCSKNIHCECMRKLCKVVTLPEGGFIFMASRLF